MLWIVISFLVTWLPFKVIEVLLKGAFYVIGFALKSVANAFLHISAAVAVLFDKLSLRLKSKSHKNTNNQNNN